MQPPITTATEEYDGTTWTAGGNLNTAREEFSRSRNSNCSFSFWWLYSRFYYSSNRRI
jgi:hypothetical protein